MSEQAEAPDTAVKRLHQILEGIDYTQSDGPDGWWETSTGMKFGAGKLAEVDALVMELVDTGDRLALALERVAGWHNCRELILAWRRAEGTRGDRDG